MINVRGSLVVIRLVPHAELDADDRSCLHLIVGSHTVEAFAPLPLDVARTLKDFIESMQEAVLKEFHTNVPIACLDDFDIVIDWLQIQPLD